MYLIYLSLRSLRNLFFLHNTVEVKRNVCAASTACEKVFVCMFRFSIWFG